VHPLSSSCTSSGEISDRCHASVHWGFAKAASLPAFCFACFLVVLESLPRKTREKKGMFAFMWCQMQIRVNAGTARALGVTQASERNGTGSEDQNNVEKSWTHLYWTKGGRGGNENRLRIREKGGKHRAEKYSQFYNVKPTKGRTESAGYHLGGGRGRKERETTAGIHNR
jgi:hypothetical protein